VAAPQIEFHTMIKLRERVV